jgi:hypothetical protein
VRLSTRVELRRSLKIIVKRVQGERELEERLEVSQLMTSNVLEGRDLKGMKRIHCLE